MKRSNVRSSYSNICAFYIIDIFFQVIFQSDTCKYCPCNSTVTRLNHVLKNTHLTQQSGISTLFYSSLCRQIQLRTDFLVLGTELHLSDPRAQTVITTSHVHNKQWFYKCNHGKYGHLQNKQMRVTEGFRKKTQIEKVVLSQYCISVLYQGNIWASDLLYFNRKRFLFPLCRFKALWFW